MKKRLLSLILALATLVGSVGVLASCGDPENTDGVTPDALVIMSEELDGVFNPFFSTTGADSTIVSMTQIGMLTSKYDEATKQAVVAYGDNEAVVVKDFGITRDEINDTTSYTFIIKNGIKFSDGKPLTINDVLFNLYVYLDPVYTGSSTLYSTKILGLQEYRTQQAGDDSADTLINNQAKNRALDRINELVKIFKEVGDPDRNGSYDADYDTMIAAIKTATISSGYKLAIAVNGTGVDYNNLIADYERALKYFKEELETDYKSAKEAFTADMYKKADGSTEFDEVTSFMAYEGFVSFDYLPGADGKPDKSKIDWSTFKRNYNTDVVKDMTSAINYVYDSKISSSLHEIVTLWATGTKLLDEYSADAKEVILKEKGENLVYPNISGIVSLGHTTSEQTVTVKNTNDVTTTYKVAHEYNDDGTVKNDDEYAVLRITIDGVDPKAVWNFSFAVAPQHYYAPGYTVDIANDKFGVERASTNFMKNVLQSSRNVKLPMGAGAYKVTDNANSDNPAENAFFKDNVVYFKANNNFLLGAPKIEKVRYQVVSASNAISTLKSGDVHFVTPQFTQKNIEELDGMKSGGVSTITTDQLGYGYIGVNAGKVADINLRKAIMCAMDTSLALQYYSAGMAKQIYWPMSQVSWAYPKNDDGSFNTDNEHDYPNPLKNFSDELAKEAILDYMSQASYTEKDLEIKFTIAGAVLEDHPTYQVFLKAAKLLNECGWNITVVADSQALSKLATGSLAVWAAAWGSTIDPDLYQVYHKNSSATSTLAWGYREILANPTKYAEENAILNRLSDVIDDARETEDQATRTDLYKTAMGYILDLAVELPVYQRNVLYAYNSNVIKASSFPSEINPYTSPLDRIWEIEFAG